MSMPFGQSSWPPAAILAPQAFRRLPIDWPIGASHAATLLLQTLFKNLPGGPVFPGVRVEHPLKYARKPLMHMVFIRHRIYLAMFHEKTS